jgi:hypothetical protein
MRAKLHLKINSMLFSFVANIERYKRTYYTHNNITTYFWFLKVNIKSLGSIYTQKSYHKDILDNCNLVGLKHFGHVLSIIHKTV